MLELLYFPAESSADLEENEKKSFRTRHIEGVISKA